MSQKYVVVSFFEHFDKGYNFPKEDWMPHVTLMPLFSTDNIDSVQTKLQQIATLTKAITVKVTGTAMFGPKKDKPVMLLDQPYQLSSLHSALVNIQGALFTSPEYNNAGYRPHITLQRGSDIQIGDNFVIDTLTLVDMYPKKDINRRQILANYALGK